MSDPEKLMLFQPKVHIFEWVNLDSKIDKTKWACEDLEPHRLIL